MSQLKGFPQAPPELALAFHESASCAVQSPRRLQSSRHPPLQALWTAFRDVHESLSALPYNLARSGTTAVVCIVTKQW